MARKGLRKSLLLPISKLKSFHPNNSRRTLNDPFRGPTGTATSTTTPLEFSPRLTDPPPDSIRASERFFVGSPAPTSSLIEEARMSCCHGGTATVTESWDPCGDFRRSIKEMVDARLSREEQQQQLDWSFIEDLLSAYLQLNDRSVHPYILRAFQDLFQHEADFFWWAGLI